MRKIIPILLSLGVCASALATPVYPSPNKSERKFRFKDGFLPPAGTPVTDDGVALVDLVVAYQKPPTWLLFGGYGKETDPQEVRLKLFLQSAFLDASKELFKATGGAVQLGRIVVVPDDGNNVDADILIRPDLGASDAASACPLDMNHPGEGALICSDATTGGYIGSAWWLPVNKQTDASLAPVFSMLDKNAAKVSNSGARIQATWKTLFYYGTSTLIHEFGHYLFAMRDEYEGVTFPTKLTYTTDKEFAMPSGVGGLAMANATYAALPGANWPFLSGFTGYGMSFVSQYSSAKGYSPKFLDATGSPKPEDYIGIPGKGVYAMTEQVASVATRGDVADKRFGGMWSMETSIRTSKCAGDLNCTYSPAVASATVVHVNDSVKIQFLTQAMGNIFLLDASGSMVTAIKGTNPQGINRWDAGVDILGRLTHPLDLNSQVSYPVGSKFGLIAFSDNPVTLVDYLKPEGLNLDATTLYTSAYSPTGSKKLAYESNPSHMIPWARGNTYLVDALNAARTTFENDPDAPVRRNLVLISDGQQEGRGLHPIDGTESIGIGYRIFPVSLDNDLKTSDYGRALATLAYNSMSWDGIRGHAFFTNGDNSDGVIEEGAKAGPKVAMAAKMISDAINGYTSVSYPPSTLFQDAAAPEFSVVSDGTMASAVFSISWTGAIAPTLWLYDAIGTQYGERNYPGIVYKQQGNLKSYTVDLTKFPNLGNWRVKTQLINSVNPITVYRSISTKGTGLKVKVSADPAYVSRTGRLPVDVVVEDGRPLEGLAVTAVLLSNRTGVKQDIPLTWNGVSYSGALSGLIQPGVSYLTVTVTHPGLGKVSYAQGENAMPISLRTPYPVFTPKVQSQEIWVPGAQPQKSIDKLVAWTVQSENRATVTALKLFIENGTSVPLTGLKARYFFSLSEAPGALPAFSTSYLAGGSKVTVGTVDKRPGLAYVQFDFAGKTLQPGQRSSNGTNGGEGGYVLKQGDWGGVWEVANDYSFNGLLPCNPSNPAWAPNPFVNIYDASGNLISGNPDLDPPGNGTNAAPIVKLKVPDLIAAGQGVTFAADAVDPDHDNLSYKWTINGVAQTSVSSSLSTIFAAAGTYAVGVEVADGTPPTGGGNRTIALQNVVVQAGGPNACTVGNSKDLGKPSSNGTWPLSAGTTCFVVSDNNVVREWNWSKLLFQANSDNGVALNGTTVSIVPGGAVNNLSGYSQTVPFADPGKGKNLYLKVYTPTARTVRLNWWMQ